MTSISATRARERPKTSSNVVFEGSETWPGRPKIEAGAAQSSKKTTNMNQKSAKNVQEPPKSEKKTPKSEKCANMARTCGGFDSDFGAFCPP